MKNKEKITGLVIVIVALVALVGSIVRFSLMEKPQVEEKVTIKEGTIAPPFTLKDLTGKEVSLADYRGKLVIIDFWATWCPPCKKELPHIQKIYDKYKDKEVIVLAIIVSFWGRSINVPPTLSAPYSFKLFTHFDI